MLKAFLILLVGIVFSVTGELLLKHGMNSVGSLSVQPSLLLPGLVRTFSNPFVIGGFASIFLGSIFWLVVISRIPLSIAYPMLSVSYVLVIIAAWLLLKESISVTRLVGAFVIISGVMIVYRS